MSVCLEALGQQFDGPHVNAVTLMRSYARGDLDPFSDIDLVRAAIQARTQAFEPASGWPRKPQATFECFRNLMVDSREHLGEITVTFSGSAVDGELAPETGHRYGAKEPRWFSAAELEAVKYHPRETVEKALGIWYEQGPETVLCAH